MDKILALRSIWDLQLIIEPTINGRLRTKLLFQISNLILLVQVLFVKQLVSEMN